MTDSPAAPPAAEAPARLVSLDALRGFDMFWIVGAEAIVHALNDIGASGFTGWLAEQFEHVQWEGFRFYDLIFPLFIFIMGAAIPMSLDKIVAAEGRKKAVFRILRRTLLLYIAGFLYTEGFARPLPDLGLMGVLQRIALCYGAAALLYIALSRRALAVLCAAVLIAYWALFSFVPVPAEPELTALNPAWGAGGISTALGNNWAHYVDHHLYVHHVGNRHFYNEGLFSTLTAVCTALLGVFAGLLLRLKTLPIERKAAILLGAGLAAVAIGSLWGLHFPIIKKLWTSSYVLVSAGYSAILLAVFLQIIDGWGWKRWAAPFVWLGANALAIYLIARFVDFGRVAEVIAGGDIAAALGDYGQLLLTAIQLSLVILLARFLYVRGILFRL